MNVQLDNEKIICPVADICEYNTSNPNSCDKLDCPIIDLLIRKSTASVQEIEQRTHNENQSIIDSVFKLASDLISSTDTWKELFIKLILFLFTSVVFYVFYKPYIINEIISTFKSTQEHSSLANPLVKSWQISAESSGKRLADIQHRYSGIDSGIAIYQSNSLIDFVWANTANSKLLGYYEIGADAQQQRLLHNLGECTYINTSHNSFLSNTWGKNNVIVSCPIMYSSIKASAFVYIVVKRAQIIPSSTFRSIPVVLDLRLFVYNEIERFSLNKKNFK